MRRTILSLLLAASLTAVGAVAAPALSTENYVPDPVEFELAPVGAAAGQEVRGDVVSRPLDAPKRFDMVGLTWKRGDVETDVDVRVRSAGGEWSPWAEATADGDGPDPGAGEATPVRASAPVWAGGADEVQYRTSEKLEGVKLEFSNTTGTATPADRAETALRKAANRGVTGVAGLFSASAAAPSMVSRAAWGGDEHCRPRTSPDIGSVKAVFVHHTATTNSYSSSDVPSMVLGICRYHRNTNGWSDIGYNFVVDKYGRIYEGRDGGIDRAVVGAQAQGWNAQTTGIANLGNHESGGQSSAGLRAMDRLITWKLDHHGTPRGGRVTLTSAGGGTNRYPSGQRVGFERISGHRDGNHTSCPGAALYRQLPRLRTAVEEGATSDTTAPAAPQNLTASSGAGTVSLNWSDNRESDLAGYRVYRRQDGTRYESIATVRSSAYTDTSVRGGEIYYYRVKAYDASGNHSASSNYATGRPTIAWEQIVDNSSSRFTASSEWGSSNKNAERYGADYRYARPEPKSDPARFTLRAPRDGSYAIYIRHPAYHGYSSGAPVHVETRAGMKKTVLDMRTEGGRWRALGTYTLAAGEEPRVLVSRWTAAEGMLIADAVKLVAR